MHGCGGREESPALLNTAPGWETVCGVSAHERESVPVALEDVLRAASDATGAEAQGSWSEAIDVLAVQAGGLELRFGDHVRRCAIALSEQAYCTDLGLWGTLSLATEVQCSNHVLTQWGHELAPFVS